MVANTNEVAEVAESGAGGRLGDAAEVEIEAEVVLVVVELEVGSAEFGPASGCRLQRQKRRGASMRGGAGRVPVRQARGRRVPVLVAAAGGAVAAARVGGLGQGAMEEGATREIGGVVVVVAAAAVALAAPGGMGTPDGAGASCGSLRWLPAQSHLRAGAS